MGKYSLKIIYIEQECLLLYPQKKLPYIKRRQHIAFQK